MYIKEEIKKLLTEFLAQPPYELSAQEITIEEPKNYDHGDYATNAALRLTKKLRRKPQEIAAEICNGLNSIAENFTFEPINGFINIRINDTFLFNNILNIDENFGTLTIGQNKKTILEYVSANPTGPLHIGHGRWAAIGDTLSRVLKKAGYTVHREFYVNDLGNQIQNFYRSVEAVKNNTAIPEDGYHGAYIHDLAKINEDPVEHMKKSQANSLKNARVEFDEWFSERSLAPSIDSVIEFLKNHNLTYEQEGALWFKATEFGDDKDRVLVKSDGARTYFLGDIAYHKNKLDRGFDLLINIWGADHHGYVKRVAAAIEALTHPPAPSLEREGDKIKFKVIIGQLVSLFRDGQPVRLSKRTGEIITLDEVTEEIGADAIRYFLARYSCDTPLEFDLSLAVKKSNENPVYYVQYAHARICSILRNHEKEKTTTHPQPLSLRQAQCGASKERGEEGSSFAINTQYKLAPSERAVMVKIARLPDELENIAQNYNIHRLCSYAEELAKLFHNFYHECRVITDNEQTTANRLAIIKSIKNTIKIVLELLGVSAPEKM